MIEKYLRNDSEKIPNKKSSKSSANKFLIRRKDEDEIELEYKKYLSKNDDEADLIGDINDSPEKVMEYNQKNYLMKSDEDENQRAGNKCEISSQQEQDNELDQEDRDIVRNFDRENRNSKNMVTFKPSNMEINELIDTPLLSGDRGTSDSLEKKSRDINFSDRDKNLIYFNPDENNKDYISQNYENYENIYLNEGRIRNHIGDNIFQSQNIEELDTYALNSPITIVGPDTNLTASGTPNEKMNIQTSQNVNIPLETNNSELFNKNEYKFKRLQEKIEEKLRDEYEQQITKKQREIESKAKVEFQDAMSKLKSELEKNLEEEKIRMEEELQRKWQEKYEDLLVDCKAKLREDKEKKLAANMYHKLRPTVEKEIYKNEYSKVEEKIRRELETKLNKDIESKKLEEVERVKRKLEYFTKVKMDEMEGNIKNKCKEEVEIEIKKELEKKEKEMKINYLRKFESFKTNLEKQLKDEYESKKKELSKEISEMKSRMYRLKCSEKLKLNKISNIKKNLEQKERVHFENAEKLEKVLINSQSIGLMNVSGLQATQAQEVQSGSSSNFYNQNQNKGYRSFYSERNLKSANTTNKFTSKTGGLNGSKNKSNKNDNKNHIQVDEYYIDDTDSYIDQNCIISQNQIKNTHMNDTAPLSKITEERNFSSCLPMSDINSGFGSKIYSNINTQSDIIDSPKSGKSPIRNKSPPQNNNAVNLMELNKKLKLFSPLSANSSEILPQQNKRECSLIIKEGENSHSHSQLQSQANLKESLNNMIMKNSKLNTKHLKIEDEVTCNNEPQLHMKINSGPISKIHKEDYKMDSPKRLKETGGISGVNAPSPKKIILSPKQKTTQNNFIVQNKNQQVLSNTSTGNNQTQQSQTVFFNKDNDTSPLKDCLSLRLNGNIPVTIVDFGKFLVKYIENEENYRILYEKENKNLKAKIRKIFEQEKVSDHCLLDYMIELWDKIEVSYCNRYKILFEIAKW
jgi:hypothetical protein